MPNFHSPRHSCAIQRLKDAGLYVYSPGTDIQNEISLSSRDDLAAFLQSRTSLRSQSLSSPTAADYWSDEWPWIFRRWECIPGPELDEFCCEFPTVEAAVDAALAFYFGQSTIIEDWIFPLHLHPEISADRVQAALGHAAVITAMKFEAIQEQRTAYFLSEFEKIRTPFNQWWRQVTALAADELRGKDEVERLRIVCEMENAGALPSRPVEMPFPRYELALQTQFLLIHHVKETSTTLRLRRDLKEVYVVR